MVETIKKHQNDTQSLHLSLKVPQLDRKGDAKLPQREPMDPKGSPKGVKGIQKLGREQTKVTPKPPSESQGTPTRSQRESKIVTRGTQGPQREPSGGQRDPKRRQDRSQKLQDSGHIRKHSGFSLLFEVPASTHFGNVHIA